MKPTSSGSSGSPGEKDIRSIETRSLEDLLDGSYAVTLQGELLSDEELAQLRSEVAEIVRSYRKEVKRNGASS